MTRRETNQRVRVRRIWNRAQCELEQDSVQRERDDLDQRVADRLLDDRLALRAKREVTVADEVRNAARNERGNVCDVRAHMKTRNQNRERREIDRSRRKTRRARAEGLKDDANETLRCHTKQSCNARATPVMSKIAGISHIVLRTRMPTSRGARFTYSKLFLFEHR